jgi:hypothetical protein
MRTALSSLSSGRWCAAAVLVAAGVACSPGDDDATPTVSTGAVLYRDPDSLAQEDCLDPGGVAARHTALTFLPDLAAALAGGG